MKTFTMTPKYVERMKVCCGSGEKIFSQKGENFKERTWLDLVRKKIV